MNKFVILFLIVLFSYQSDYAQSDIWTWMKGDSAENINGVYGTKGVSSLTNKPGARTGAANFRDAAGNLWLFGGVGYASTDAGFLNDLWRYDIPTNSWTWVNGDYTANGSGWYGSAGVSSSFAKPGARSGSASWVDASNNFWLFGGWTASGLSYGYLNDLWKYNRTTNQWTWMKGDTTLNGQGMYGTQGVASPANYPASRAGSSTWTDAAGNLWLFGGGNFGGYNDLWKYNIATNEWTWMKGDLANNPPGIYGIKGVSSVSHRPGGRGGAASWVDNTGKLWLFGGSVPKTGGGEYKFNDLWKYDVSTNAWTWVNGDSSYDKPSVYGTRGVSSSTNKLGARVSPAWWKDLSGDFWVFGGYGYGSTTQDLLTDMWKYNVGLNQWTWVGGDSSGLNGGIYGTQGIGTSYTLP